MPQREPRLSPRRFSARSRGAAALQQSEDGEVEHVQLRRVTVRYIDAIYRREYTASLSPHRARRSRRCAGRIAAPRIPAVRDRSAGGTPVHCRRARHTDYALARRAVLRDLRRGAVTRLDVCDAHPELIRAARNIGEVAPTTTARCAARRNVRYVSYVYGEKLSQANGRCISHVGSSEARHHARRVRLLRRRGLPRLPLEPPHAPRAPRPPPRRRRRAVARRAAPLAR